MRVAPHLPPAASTTPELRTPHPVPGTSHRARRQAPGTSHLARRQAPGTKHPLAPVLVLSLVLAALAGAEVIDRVVATVGSRTITLSDVRAAVSLGFVSGADATEPARETIDAVVDRQLVWLEVERFGPGAPQEAAVDARVASITDRLSENELQKVMARAGLDVPRLRALVREQLQIERYLADRFGAAAQPTEEEVRLYFRDHPSEFVKDGTVLPFEEAEPLARTKLSDVRRRELIDSWIAGLRRRTPIVIREAPPETDPR
jgi:hypothetical protein